MQRLIIVRDSSNRNRARSVTAHDNGSLSSSDTKEND
jgi:hypothetical protein